ncbi:regulatory protein LuxR [Pseudomonas syringae BRIP39023]|nr:regulatory protein LuxR [Pseudomonas syringae BRIP39023]
MALSLRSDMFGHEKSTGRQKLEWEFEQSASERGVHHYAYFFIITRQPYSNMALFWSAVRRQGKRTVIVRSGRT